MRALCCIDPKNMQAEQRQTISLYNKFVNNTPESLNKVEAGFKTVPMQAGRNFTFNR